MANVVPLEFWQNLTKSARTNLRLLQIVTFAKICLKEETDIVACFFFKIFLICCFICKIFLLKTIKIEIMNQIAEVNQRR